MIIRVPDDRPDINSAFQSSAEGDTVLVSNGNYQETVWIPQGLRTFTGNYIFSGNAIDIETTILAPSDTTTSDTACCLYMAAGCSLNVVGFTFENGRGVRRSNDRREGGAINARSSSLFVTDCVFQNCFADFGVCVWANAGSDLIFRRTQFVHNGRNNGTVISQGTIRSIESNLRVDSCRFSHNTVTGGAAIIADTGTVLFECCVVDSNTNPSASLGAITSGGAELTVRSSLFQDNTHGSIFSGICIFAEERATVLDCRFIRNVGRSTLSLWGNPTVVQNCVFDANESLLSNPGCIVFGYGQNTIEDCAFTNNSAPEWSILTTNAATMVRNCYFANNFSLNDSGGTMIPTQNVVLQAENSSFEGNQPNAFSTVFTWFQGSIDARNCYWGSSTGPYHELQNPSGQGDLIWGDDVLFDPWLLQSPLGVTYDRPPLAVNVAIDRVFPNPFNSTVTIEYTLTHEQDVTLAIYDLLGRQVETLFSERQEIGVHTIKWNADHYASGLFFARLTSLEPNVSTQTVKLILMK